MEKQKIHLYRLEAWQKCGQGFQDWRPTRAKFRPKESGRNTVSFVYGITYTVIYLVSVFSKCPILRCMSISMQRTGNTPTTDFSSIQNLSKVGAFPCSPRLEIDHQNLSMGQKQARERLKERKVKKAFATQKSKTDKKKVTQKSKTKISSRHKKIKTNKMSQKNLDKAKRHTKIKTRRAFGPNKTQKVGSPSSRDRHHRPKTRPAWRKLPVYFCSRL